MNFQATTELAGARRVVLHAVVSPRRCPICNNPARWVALLEQGGQHGKHITKLITQTINNLISRASALSGGCSLKGISKLRLRGATRRLPRSEYVRAIREAARNLGLCTNCRKHKAKPGYSQCGECQKERNRRKRMARRIGTRKCPCGNPAVNIWSGEYICADCMKRERANE